MKIMDKERPKETKRLVSVYIPTHNRLKLLKRAISSVLAQTYSNIQLIVVNDGSTDGTGEYLATLSKFESRVKLIDNKVPRGACHARNLAIKAADGFFLTGLDDDDFFLPQRIEMFVNYWFANRNSFALFSSYSVIHPNTAIKSYRRESDPTTRSHFLKNGIGNQVFSKKENYIKAGLFDENLKVLQDFEFWYRFMKLGKVARVENYSYIFDHSHDSSRISTSKAKTIRDSVDYIIKKHDLDFKSIVRFRLFSANYNFDRSFFKNFLLAAASLDLKALFLSVKLIAKKFYRATFRYID